MSTKPERVKLTFEGVMICRCDDKKKVFEMGVLPVPNHSFSITIKERGPFGVKTTEIAFNDTEINPDKIAWQMEVPSRVANARQPGDSNDATCIRDLENPPNRTELPLNAAHVFDPSAHLDIQWVPDLACERDFPNHVPSGTKELPRHPGLLKPVLLITTGSFYATRVNPTPLKRRQGPGGEFEPFGFVPEQVCADLDLKEDEELLLKVSSTQEEIFRLRMKTGTTYDVFFRNVPPDETAQSAVAETRGKPDINRPTHFQLVYLLVDLPPQKRYEVRFLPDAAASESEPSVPALDMQLLAERIGGDVSVVETIRAVTLARGAGIGVPTPRCAPEYVTSKKSLLY